MSLPVVTKKSRMKNPSAKGILKDGVTILSPVGVGRSDPGFKSTCGRLVNRLCIFCVGVSGPGSSTTKSDNPVRAVGKILGASPGASIAP